MQQGPIPLVIAAVMRAGDDALFFELQAPDGAPLPPGSPGAHINLALPNGVSRSYSLLDAPPVPRAYRIAVKREPHSRGGSAWLHDRARVGDTLHAAPPANHFPLVEDARHSVLFAGGIGITPVWCMVRRLRRLGRSFELHYRARSRAGAVLFEEMADEDLRGRVHLSFSDEPAAPRLDIPTVVDLAPQGSHLYCCGPAGMIDAFRHACADVDPARVHMEQFSAETGPLTRGFTLRLNKSGRQLRIAPGDTILQRLREIGVQVPASCEQGVCGSCETRVVSGAPDHKDLILSEQERQSGAVMMICCSGALSPELELDL